MRKRSKKRIPQDEQPWARIISRDDDKINIFNKSNIHWHSGNRRYKQNTMFNNHQLKQFATISTNALLHDNKFLVKSKDMGSIMHQRLFHKFYLKKFLNENSAKNFCLFLGKSSTYNRQLFISRQTVRKLMKIGMLAGIQKK